MTHVRVALNTSIVLILARACVRLEVRREVRLTVRPEVRASTIKRSTLVRPIAEYGGVGVLRPSEKLIPPAAPVRNVTCPSTPWAMLAALVLGVRTIAPCPPLTELEAIVRDCDNCTKDCDLALKELKVYCKHWKGDLWKRDALPSWFKARDVLEGLSHMYC